MILNLTKFKKKNIMINDKGYKFSKTGQSYEFYEIKIR